MWLCARLLASFADSRSTEDDRVIVKQEKVDDYPEPPSPGPVGLSSPVLSRPEDMGV